MYMRRNNIDCSETLFDSESQEELVDDDLVLFKSCDTEVD